MLPRTTENPWVRRTKWLTQALIISVTLNIGLVTTFIYFVLKDKQTALAIELTPCKDAHKKEVLATNFQLLRAYSLLPYQELILRLEHRDLLEEGLTKRDLSLACLVAFHHFNLEKALGGILLQKRSIPFTNSSGQETIEIPVFPGLSDDQFQAVLQYAKTEKWPLTSQGLFYELKRSSGAYDPSLIEAFSLCSEYHAVQTLLSKTGLHVTREQIIELIAEGEWKALSELTAKQRISMELTPDRKRAFLLEYLQNHSKLAAKLLLDSDQDFVLKRLGDGQILTILDLYPEKNAVIENFSKELLASPRTDAVWRRAAYFLYSAAGELFPEPYDHQAALQRFLPQIAAPQIAPDAAPIVLQTSAPLPKGQTPSKGKKKVHVVEPGDNLWKLARKYHVSIEEIMRVNRLETEKLRPGKQIEIPEKTEKR